jgi:NAD(P)H-nitrite reductase large subunit
VVYLSDIEPPAMLETFAEAAYLVIEAHTLMGVLAAVLLRRNFSGKEVKLFIKDESLLQSFRQQFPEESEKEIYREEIVECIGEGALKAVRLNTGKVYAADLFFVDTGLEPNPGPFESAGFFKFEEKAFVVDDSLRTNVTDICAVGDAANRGLIADRLLLQTTAQINGQIKNLVRSLTNDSPELEDPTSLHVPPRPIPTH